ncbi:MAG: hypothetical protein DHS20C17_16230 [Cyclobacteriaceae bacterium]|nr:MAG: hypothetical protein DHS20C17_16230 [Cyclobacteriaceae bacterium]
MLDSTNQSLFINKNTQFHAASTMKTPVMIEAFKRIELAQFTLADSLQITNRFKSIVDQSEFELSVSDDSEPELYQQINQYRAIGDLIELMITRSSNLANNILIEYLGAENITQSMEDLGAGGIKILRGVEDIKAFESGLNNTTDAISLMIIFEKMANLQLVSESASRQMIDILKKQQYNEVIPAKLPPEVQTAHKTGSITGVRHDSGIIYLPDGRKYVLILLSKDLPEVETGTRLLQNISRMIYDYVEGI